MTKEHIEEIKKQLYEDGLIHPADIQFLLELVEEKNDKSKWVTRLQSRIIDLEKRVNELSQVHQEGRTNDKGKDSAIGSWINYIDPKISTALTDIDQFWQKWESLSKWVEKADKRMDNMADEILRLVKWNREYEENISARSKFELIKLFKDEDVSNAIKELLGQTTTLKSNIGDVHYRGEIKEEKPYLARDIYDRKVKETENNLIEAIEILIRNEHPVKPEFDGVTYYSSLPTEVVRQVIDRYKEWKEQRK